MKNAITYLTSSGLYTSTKYVSRTINEHLKDSELLVGLYYIHRFYL